MCEFADVHDIRAWHYTDMRPKKEADTAVIQPVSDVQFESSTSLTLCKRVPRLGLSAAVQTIFPAGGGKPLYEVLCMVGCLLISVSNRFLGRSPCWHWRPGQKLLQLVRWQLYSCLMWCWPVRQHSASLCHWFWHDRGICMFANNCQALQIEFEMALHLCPVPC